MASEILDANPSIPTNREVGQYAKGFDGYRLNSFRWRLQGAAEAGLLLAVKWGVVVALWLGSGYLAVRQSQLYLEQAMHGQQAFQWLVTNEKPLVALVEAEKAKQAGLPDAKAAEKK